MHANAGGKTNSKVAVIEIWTQLNDQQIAACKACANYTRKTHKL